MNTSTWHKMLPDRNCFRFYTIKLESDLFAPARVACEWGRIGSGKHPQRQVLCFGSVEEAEVYRDRQEKVRLKRGYQLVN
jgi:predicted DNA-binding WGR domain protein